MEAVKTYGKMLINRTTEEIFNNFAAVWKELAHESQFRWVGKNIIIVFDY